MKVIYSFIFDRLTDPLGLPISPLWEYLILAVIGAVAFGIAWDASPGGEWGSEIHWGVRLIAFFALWAITYAVIWVIKQVIAYWIPIVCVMGAALAVIITIAIAKQANRKAE